MNQVVPISEKRGLVAGARPQAIVPQTFEDAYRIANAVCQAGMAPKGMDKPESCMIAIMMGLEVGLTPMAAIQRIAIINGKPSIWGDAAIGLVEASGLSEFIKEGFEGTGDERLAFCETRRKGKPNTVRMTFSVSQAKKANLWGKSGPWQQYQDRMLQMRARGYCLRDVYADVLGGLYLREELEGGEGNAPAPTPPAPPKPPAAPAIEHQQVKTVVPSTPEVREQMVTSPQAPADIRSRIGDEMPDFLRRTDQKPEATTKAEIIDGEVIDPSEILNQARQAFTTARAPEELETLLDEFMHQLEFPTDREALYAEMKTHEKRLEREAP